MFKNKIGLLVVLLLALAIGNEIYKQINKVPKSAKTARLDCHKKTITFEKVLKPKLIKELHQVLASEDYKLEIFAEKAKHMETKMFNYVDVDVVEKDIIEKFNNHKLKSKIAKNGSLIIDVLIYENDKKDPGKKTKRSKLYAGYLEFTFKLNKKVVYKIQSDFMKMKGEDIPDRISCIIDSVMSLEEI